MVDWMCRQFAKAITWGNEKQQCDVGWLTFRNKYKYKCIRVYMCRSVRLYRSYGD